MSDLVELTRGSAQISVVSFVVPVVASLLSGIVGAVIGSWWTSKKSTENQRVADMPQLKFGYSINGSREARVKMSMRIDNEGLYPVAILGCEGDDIEPIKSFRYRVVGKENATGIVFFVKNVDAEKTVCIKIKMKYRTFQYIAGLRIGLKPNANRIDFISDKSDRYASFE